MRYLFLKKQTESNEERTKQVNKYLVAILMLLLIVFSVLLFLFRGWIGETELSSYALSEVSDIAADREGNLYILADATDAVLKVSPDGVLLDRIRFPELDDMSSAIHIAVGGDDNIYLHEVVIDQGVLLEKEQIGRLNSKLHDLEVLDTIWEKDGTVRQSVAGIAPTKTGIRYIKKDSSGMVVYDENATETVSCSYPKADEQILYAVTDDIGNDIFYVTYNGEVYRYVNGKEDTLLYDSDEREGSVPQSVSYADGILYVTDIGLRDIIMINVDTGEMKFRSTEGEIKERAIEYFVSATNHMVSAGEYSITLWNETDYVQLWDLEIGGGVKAKIIFTWIAIFYIGIFLFIMLTRLLHYFFRRANIYSKVAFFIFIGVAILVALLVGTMFPEFLSQLTEQIYEKEILAASVVADQIPEDSFLALNKPSDFMNEDYKKVQSVLDSVFASEDSGSQAYYCVLYRLMDGVITLTYTMEDICVVYPYDWEYEGSGMQDVMEKGTISQYSSTSNTGSYLFVHYPITGSDGNIIGLVEVGTDLNSVTEKNKNIILSMLLNVFAMTVAVIMLLVEIMYYVKDRNAYIEKNKHSTDPVSLPPGIFRFIVFLIFLFTNLTCVILPIHAKELAGGQGIFGLSPAISAAIPISAEVFSGAVFSALGGKIIDKLGAKKAILVSGISFTLGLLVRVVPHILMLILGSVLLGAGWGVLLIMVNVQIAELSDEEKDKGYSYYSVSSISGVNCGVILGGFLVQWCSYTTIFLITAAVSVLLYIVCRKYLADNMPKYDKTESEENTSDGHSNWRLILSPRVLCFFGMVLTPLLICGYFLNYLFPILGSEWGMSDSYISYAFMISGVIVLCFGTHLTEVFTRRNLRRFGLTVSVLLYAEAFLAMALMENIPSLLLALVLIGFADSFGIPLLTSYFTELDEVEQFGYDRAFGVYSVFENGAQSLGAYVLGIVYNIGIQKGMLLLVGVITIFALAFFFTSLPKKSACK